MLRFLCLMFFYSLSSLIQALPTGFVYLHDIDPTIIEDMRYATTNNFTGHRVPGYQVGRCILTRQAAIQLSNAQKEANKQGYSFKVYDCYRPKMAVNAFYEWSKTADETTKKAFYPREEKNNLFTRQYIALDSKHSRGSTIDLTLVKLGTTQAAHPSSSRCYGKTTHYLNDNSINTGSRFDCFDVSVFPSYQNLSKEQKANRQFLTQLMMRYDFVPSEVEWWHFTLDHEPYPNTYFNFIVR